MIRPVLKRGDERLLQPANVVEDAESVSDLVADLWETLTAIQGLYRFTRGSGLSATQIGEPWRVSVIEFADRRYSLINPVLKSYSEEIVAVDEGCLSFFDYRGTVLRYADVEVVATSSLGSRFSLESHGNLDLASLLQHELEHLDGQLYDGNLVPGEHIRQLPSMPQIP